MALPRLAPGKSVRFALLPEGQDPDDLCARAGARRLPRCSAARAGSPTCCGRARPKRLRSTRRSAARRWKRASRRSSRGIGDETVRRYYGEDFVARLRAAHGAEARSRRAAARTHATAAFRIGRAGQSGGRGWQRTPRRATAALAGSLCRRRAPRLSSSPIVRGFRSAVPPREALILITVVNHPWLLENHAEEFAELELLNPDADRSRRAILEPASTIRPTRPWPPTRCGRRSMRAGWAAAGPHRGRDHPHVGLAGAAGTATGDVVQWWTHVVTLHRKKRTLNKELKDAERALGEEPTDANLAWLRDVQAGFRRSTARSPNRGFWGAVGPRGRQHLKLSVLVLSAGSGTE